MNRKNIVVTTETCGVNTFVTIKNIVTGKSASISRKGYVRQSVINEIIKQAGLDSDYESIALNGK